MNSSGRTQVREGSLTSGERLRVRAGASYFSSSGHVRHDQTLSKQSVPSRGEFGRTVQAAFTGAHSSQYVIGSGSSSGSSPKTST